MEVADLAFRQARIEDAPALARTTQLGFQSYRAWAHPGWRPPDHRLEVRGIRERLKRPDAWCLVAVEPDGEPAGHVGFMAAGEREPPYAGIPGRAHLWMLFVRPPWWGTGLAARLHALAAAEAARQGYRTMQLYTPSGQARARAFYEREGWKLDGRPFGEPLLDLELVRYRRELGAA
jgi:GNAT superfamily N-acetyltransferase